MIETATGVTEGPVGQVAPAASSAPAGHAGPAEPDIAPVPDISGHFVVGAVEAVRVSRRRRPPLASPTAAGSLPKP
jgi:hypothetical protein